MSTIEAIGNALSYDACEAALASGCSLDSVLRLASAAADLGAVDGEPCPVSLQATVPASGLRVAA